MNQDNRINLRSAQRKSQQPYAFHSILAAGFFYTFYFKLISYSLSQQRTRHFPMAGADSKHFFMVLSSKVFNKKDNWSSISHEKRSRMDLILPPKFSLLYFVISQWRVW